MMGGYQSDAMNSSGGWKTKGYFDASSNPPFPAGDKDDVLIVSSPGRVGADLDNAVFGILTNKDDIMYCKESNDGGSLVEIDNAWIVIPHINEIPIP